MEKEKFMAIYGKRKVQFGNEPGVTKLKLRLVKARSYQTEKQN
jgi:hypothetical protein